MTMLRPETWPSGRQQRQRASGSSPMFEAEGRPEEFAVVHLAGMGRAGAAAGEDATAGRVHVVRAGQRQVGLGLSQLAGVAEVDGRLLGLDHRAALGGGQLRAQRQQHAPHLHQRVDEHDPLAGARPRPGGGGARGPAPAAVRLQPPGHPGRLGLELRVAHLRAVGDQRRAVGAALGSLGEPVVELHRPDIVPIMPQRPKGAPSEAELYAPIAWQTAGEYGDIRYETAEGIAKITIDRPEVRNAFRPQTLIEVSAAMELAREDTEVGVIVLTGEGRRAFCSGGDQNVRGDTGYAGVAGPATSPRAPRWDVSTSPICRCRCGGCRSRWWRWSPATRSAAATSCTSA